MRVVDFYSKLYYLFYITLSKASSCICIIGHCNSLLSNIKPTVHPVRIPSPFPEHRQRLGYLLDQGRNLCLSLQIF